MSKAKELIKELNKVFKLPELDAALSASNLDEAINDDLLNKVKETTGTEWLTVDAAKNSQALSEHFKEKWKPVHTKSFLTENEKRLSDMFADDEEISGELTKRQKFDEKLSFLKDELKKAKSTGSSDEVEKLKKNISDYKKQISTFEESKNQEIEAIKKASTEEITGYKNGLIKERFKQTALSKEWADAYKIDDVRNPVLDSAFSKLSEKAIIDLDKTGNIVLKNKENPELELYDGTKKVTFDSLVDAQIAPFIKKSNTPPDPQNLKQQKQVTTEDLSGMNWQARQIALKRQQQQTA